METNHTVGHVGWSPDYKSTSMPPVTGKLIARRSAAACSVCEDVLKRLGGHTESRLDGDTGLAAATMRSHEALLRVCELLEAWKITLKNRNGVTWNAMDAGDTQRLKMSIDHLEAAISPPNVEATHGGTPLSLPDCSRSSETTNQA